MPKKQYTKLMQREEARQQQLQSFLATIRKPVQKEDRNASR